MGYKNITDIGDAGENRIVDRMICDARAAIEAYSKKSLNCRKEIISNIRTKLRPYIREIAERELQETCMGNVQDKIIKLVLALDKTPGTEELQTEVVTGDDGITMREQSAYGIALAIHPATNPCATLISNAIGMLAAGNVVINVPNPRSAGVSAFLTEKINKVISEICGISNLLITVSEPRKDVVDELINHPDISLVVATGGRGMMKMAMCSPKRVIAAGPGNPVAIVDETADIEKAAKDISDGASFDHNIMCISEKSIVIVSSVLPSFIEALEKSGVQYMDNEEDIIKLTKTILNQDMKMVRKLEGKSAMDILQEAEIQAKGEIRLIAVKSFSKHPFVLEELMLPVIPLVSVADFDEALDTALFIEQGYRHTAMMHSQLIGRLNKAAKVMNTTMFIKNGSSLGGIGLGGEEKVSFTIANMTGEGITTAKDFTYKRSCTLSSGFSIR